MAEPVVLVDAANVVGSRPDGWWRDRAGAAARLVARLQGLPGTLLPADGPRPGEPVARVVVVLEGAARSGVAETPGTPPVQVRHAPGEGDALLAELCGPDVVLVTADRRLAQDGRARGAAVAGPSWLLAELPAGR